MGLRLRAVTLRPGLLAGFVAGVLTGAALTAAASSYSFDQLRVFTEALHRIDTFYVDERDPSDLLYDAIGGLTQGLDDHSVFLDPDAYRDMREQTTGEYFGVGVAVDIRDGRIFVDEPVEGSPAELAGVQPGDEIVAVDDALVAEVGTEKALALVRGDRGTVVVLTVVREGRDQPLDISVTRDRVRTRSVEYTLLPGGVGRIDIDRFQRQTYDETQRALTELEEEAGGRLDGIVLDLRGNPGGYLRQAVSIADLWVEGGTIVSTIDRSDEAQKDEAHRAGTDSRTPIAVLVDGGSASAAEIVAGALQDHGRGTLIGYTTYGKGSVQQFFDLSDGSALKLTTARYYTPNHHNIHGSGITPDLALGPRGADEPGRDLGPLLDEYPIPQELWGDPTLHVALAWLQDEAAVESWFAAPSKEPDVGPPAPLPPTAELSVPAGDGPTPQ
jgi:carboxyl-terminal processing protease